MKSLKNIAPLLLVTNPATISAFSVLSNEPDLPDSSKNQVYKKSELVSGGSTEHKKWGFLDGLEDVVKSTKIDKKDSKQTKNEEDVGNKMVCKDGVCYLSFDDDDNKEPVKKSDNQLFVVEESTSFVDNYNKTKNANQGLKR